jgi:hypothetical protein
MIDRRVIAALAIIMVLFLGAVLPQFDHYWRTGRFSPIEKIEALQSPTAVKGWTEAGLLLDGGRTIQLPGFRSLPAQSDALTEVVQRGVEIATNGRIFGLVKVHHWCGNDPVREHIAKVDISHMLLFLRVGESLDPITGTDFAVRTPGGRFSKYGWDLSEYMQFTSWVSWIEYAQSR